MSACELVHPSKLGVKGQFCVQCSFVGVFMFNEPILSYCCKCDMHWPFQIWIWLVLVFDISGTMIPISGFRRSHILPRKKTSNNSWVLYYTVSFMLKKQLFVKTCAKHICSLTISRAGSIRKNPDTIRIAIRTKQYAIRIDDTIQR